MNTQSDAVPQDPTGPRETVPAAVAETRPLYWSVRRELWEFRSIYIVPLAFAAVFLFGFLISIVTITRASSFQLFDAIFRRKLSWDKTARYRSTSFTI